MYKLGLQLIMGYKSFLQITREIIYERLVQGVVILLLFLPITEVSEA